MPKKISRLTILWTLLFSLGLQKDANSQCLEFLNTPSKALQIPSARPSPKLMDPLPLTLTRNDPKTLMAYRNAGELMSSNFHRLAAQIQKPLATLSQNLIELESIQRERVKLLGDSYDPDRATELAKRHRNRLKLAQHTSEQLFYAYEDALVGIERDKVRRPPDLGPPKGFAVILVAGALVANTFPAHGDLIFGLSAGTVAASTFWMLGKSLFDRMVRDSIKGGNSLFAGRFKRKRSDLNRLALTPARLDKLHWIPALKRLMARDLNEKGIDLQDQNILETLENLSTYFDPNGAYQKSPKELYEPILRFKEDLIQFSIEVDEPTLSHQILELVSALPNHPPLALGVQTWWRVASMEFLTAKAQFDELSIHFDLRKKYGSLIDEILFGVHVWDIDQRASLQIANGDSSLRADLFRKVDLEPERLRWNRDLVVFKPKTEIARKLIASLGETTLVTDEILEIAQYNSHQANVEISLDLKEHEITRYNLNSLYGSRLQAYEINTVLKVSLVEDRPTSPRVYETFEIPIHFATFSNRSSVLKFIRSTDWVGGFLKNYLGGIRKNERISQILTRLERN